MSSLTPTQTPMDLRQQILANARIARQELQYTNDVSKLEVITGEASLDRIHRFWAALVFKDDSRIGYSEVLRSDLASSVDEAMHDLLSSTSKLIGLQAEKAVKAQEKIHDCVVHLTHLLHGAPPWTEDVEAKLLSWSIWAFDVWNKTLQTTENAEAYKMLLTALNSSDDAVRRAAAELRDVMGL